MLEKLAVAALSLAALAAFDPLAPQAAAPAKPAAAGRYDIDNVHSAVMFKILHLGTSWSYGRFNQVSGSVLIDADQPAESMLQLRIDAKSVDTNDEAGQPDASKDARDIHLRGADFFNVEEHPTIEFESTKMTPKADGKFEVVGDLTLHGVTKSVTATGSYVGTNSGPMFGTIAGWEAKLVIDRRDFGMTYAPDAIGTEVTVLISIEAKKR